jgi:hypothetical protein
VTTAGPIARTAVLAAILFAFFALAYASAPLSLQRQHWDSLEYAHACEVRVIQETMWGNHPLGHLLQCGVFQTARRLGYSGRALPVLQGVSAVMGAAAVAAFFIVMTRVIGVCRTRAVGGSLVLGGAYGAWRHAGTSDIYGLSMLTLIVAWGLLLTTLERPSHARGARAGIAFGVAALAHQLGAVVLAIGTLGLLPLMGRRRARSALVAFVITAATTTVIGYVGAGVFRFHNQFMPREILAWIVGHGSDPTYGRPPTLDRISLAVRGLSATLVRDTEFASLTVAVVAAAGVALLVVSAIGIPRLSPRLGTIAIACALQCLAVWAVITWWEPYHVGKFWLLTLPSLVTWWDLALAGVAERGGTTWARVIQGLPLVVGMLVVLNTASVMAVYRRSDPAWERALTAWVTHSTADDVLLESGMLVAHLRFWGERPRTVNLYRVIQAAGTDSDRFVKLRALIDDTMQAGHAVLFAPGLSTYFTDDRLGVIGTTRREVEAFLDRYPREGPLFTYQESATAPVHTVYRLTSAPK